MWKPTQAVPVNRTEPVQNEQGFKQKQMETKSRR